MIEALKKLDKKFLILTGVIIAIPILIIVILAAVQGCSKKGTTYEKYENEMISSAEKYFKDNDMIPTEEGKKVTVKLSTLIKKDYIKSSEIKLKDDTCSGSVSVRRNGSSEKLDEEGILNYTVDLNCDNYSTKHLIDLIKENIVTEGDGLYQIGDEYVFKGESPRNYISFDKTIYRIVGIDKDGLVKIINSNERRGVNVWDSKYNVDVDMYYGLNKYEDSSILKTLDDEYFESQYLKSIKDKIVSHDLCLDLRDANDLSLNKTCNHVLEKQHLSLLNITDYAYASLDPNCNSIVSQSCGNYNYLQSLELDTWLLNAVSNNSYEVYYLNDGLVSHKEAIDVNDYVIVFYIDGDEIASGKGMESNPYVLD